MSEITDRGLADGLADVLQKPKLPPIVLRSAHDYTIATQALIAYEDVLSKVAKKNAEIGYDREAHSLQKDADEITVAILPQFQAQQELPLFTAEQVEAQIFGALRPLVFPAFDGLDNPKVVILPVTLHSRRDFLMKRLTQAVRAYAVELAQDAFDQGMAARAQSAEALSVRCIRALREV